MFTLVETLRNEQIGQNIYTYKNEADTLVEIYVDDEAPCYSNSKIFCVLIKDPKQIVYGVSLSYALSKFHICIDRPIDIPLEDVDAMLLKYVKYLKDIAEELEAIIKKYE